MLTNSIIQDKISINTEQHNHKKRKNHNKYHNIDDEIEDKESKEVNTSKPEENKPNYTQRKRNIKREQRKKQEEIDKNSYIETNENNKVNFSTIKRSCFCIESLSCIVSGSITCYYPCLFCGFCSAYYTFDPYCNKMVKCNKYIDNKFQSDFCKKISCQDLQSQDNKICCYCLSMLFYYNTLGRCMDTLGDTIVLRPEYKWVKIK